jgi:hypothetical protein
MSSQDYKSVSQLVTLLVGNVWVGFGVVKVSLFFFF